ncbi:molybdopterin dehydrogenase [Pseudolabrys taiwanensis]|uniref:Molybdopterin dehydrogenase n=1 Tax=Pseudolabrys taiwanensis TaxID=331696 RepID=A0A345ZWK6_9HYPH|nr:FAD binding domain-containing protein [Pseudolabrys taiwanensis]AXK81303.1 molybdopterin dehydrogenase [Pseudolabrys taiwanensis]
MLICDEYITPATLSDAFAAMERHRGRYRVVAGCTDTLPWAREGRAGDVEIPVLIDVSKIPELNERRADGAHVRLGAATPVQRFLDDAVLGRTMPAMPRCAVWFADDQIRAHATVGGNIVNASPAADLIPCLIAHDAAVELATANGRRSLALREFTLGPGKTALQEGELVTAIVCDALPGYGGSFEKVGHRRSLVISTVCLAVLVKLDAAGRVFEDVRLAIAGVCPAPRRLTEIEQALRGVRLSSAKLEEVADMPLDVVQSRTRQEYRRDVVRGFLMRGLINAAKRAGADPTALPQDFETTYA